MEQRLIRLTPSLSAPRIPTSAINVLQALTSRVTVKHVEEALVTFRGLYGNFTRLTFLTGLLDESFRLALFGLRALGHIQ